MDTTVLRMMSVDYDEERDALKVEVPLPNVRKETIDVDVYPDWFALRAVRADAEEAEFMGQFNLCCQVDRERVTGTYEDGVLKLLLPLPDGSVRPKRIVID